MMSPNMLLLELAALCGFHHSEESQKREICFYHSMDDKSVRTEWFKTKEEAFDYFENEFHNLHNLRRK